MVNAFCIKGLGVSPSPSTTSFNLNWKSNFAVFSSPSKRCLSISQYYFLLPGIVTPLVYLDQTDTTASASRRAVSSASKLAISAAMTLSLAFILCRCLKSLRQDCSQFKASLPYRNRSGPWRRPQGV